MKKRPQQPEDKYVVRFPDGLRDRIKAAAAANNRSMNAEIVSALELAFPEPPNLAETVADIQRYADMLHRFRGPETLHALADSLDSLMLEISRDRSVSDDVRKEAEKLAIKHGKFTRFVPPSED